MFDFDLEEINWIAAALAVMGALFAWWYVGFLGTSAGIFIRVLAGLGTFVIGYFVATLILER